MTILTNILIVKMNLNDYQMFDKMYLDRFQLIPMLLINLTCVTDWHFQQKYYSPNLFQANSFYFCNQPVILGFQKFTC